jgi:predicted esterase
MGGVLVRTKNIVLLFAWALAFVLGGQLTAGAEGQRYKDEVFASVIVTPDIPFAWVLGEHGLLETLKMDLYEPEGDTEPVRPTFIWIHGGGFYKGDKADPINVEIATRFAKRGYVTASINYRLREGDYFEPGDPDLPQVIQDAQHDAQAAVRWLRANAATYGVDADRIAIGGTSAGAITALFVNYNASDPGESGNPGYPSDTSAVIDVSGAVDTSLMETGEPPAMVVHGMLDTRVPYSLALNIVARAQTVGITVEFHPIEGAGHMLWQSGYTETIIPWMSDFLYRHVIASPAAPVGGIAAPSHTASASAEEATAPAGSSGWSAWAYAALAGGLAAPVVVITAEAWYARKRRRAG